MCELKMYTAVEVCLQELHVGKRCRKENTISDVLRDHVT